MAFKHTQIRTLAGKLPERFVKARTERGLTLSYVEGWHVIDEANRVFGFDGWDRETVSAECVWQDVRITPKACSYAVRVRIKVRAGKIIISREGSGFGHGTGATLGEAHESALKEAETDATKRALVTFGNLFGLALYDKAQAGVQRAKGTGHAAPVVWPLVTGNAPPQICETPQQFCSAAKENLRYAKSTAELEALWTGNAAAIAQLRAARPELRTKQGTHYADVLESLYRQQRRTLEPVAPSDRQPVKTLAQGQPTSMAVEPRSPEAKTVDGLVAAAERTTVVAPPEVSMVELRSPILVPAGGTPVAQTPEDAVSTPAIPMARRVRDAAHLKYVASLPCLVCGRTPSHAHHLRFAQPRSLGSKPSDEWTVPLCPIHHHALHDVGREEDWWQANGIDGKAEAVKLWQTTHAPTPNIDRIASATNEAKKPPPEASNAPAVLPEPPTDSRGQPLPINLRADVPRLS